MADITDFTRGKGWTLKNGNPQSTYPNGHILLIASSQAPSVNGLADLSWIDSDNHLQQLLGVPFDQTNGFINGPTSDGNFMVTVTMTADKQQLTGTVNCPTQLCPTPLVGTWGADANGGREEKP
jgi:hypothetical protein